MAGVPDADDCRALLRRANADEAVLRHTDAVARVADAIAREIEAQGHEVDRPLVRAGAHLHDVGRARTHGLDHALVGADMLRAQGQPEPLCLIVERHTGGGIDAEEARALGLPPKDYTPRTLEERIVCQADNLVDNDRRQRVADELADLRRRGLDRVAVKIENLHRDLSRMAGRDLDEIE